MARDGWPVAPVIYEIYPRSFLDTTGSGTGDLAGICAKMDHVAALGVDAIWIAPFFPSPLEDGGYDVADHCAVHPDLGDLGDFDRLVAAAHGRDLKVMIDQVLNHTSISHDWFGKSARREDGFDDWHVWRDPRPDGTPPNNWMSYFGRPAWNWDHRREQYYWHQFLACQPNLNLRHPGVQKAHEDQMRFWRARGVDGFRMDAVSAYLHDETFRDNPPASGAVHEQIAGPGFSPYSYQEHVHDLQPEEGATFCETVRGWAGDDAWLLGEINIGNASVEVARDFAARPGRLDAAYVVDFAERGFTPEVIADVIARSRDCNCAGSLAMWLSSHDQARHVSAQGDGSDRDARFLAFACALLPGPWLIYQGEELGLPQPELSRDETGDPYDLYFWPDGPGREGAVEGGPAQGFLDAEPWLPMRWRQGLSVAAQSGEETSVLAFYRSLVPMRRTYGWGAGRVVDAEPDHGMLRLDLETETGRYRACLNFSEEAVRLETPGRAPLLETSPGAAGECLAARSGAIWAAA